MRILTAAAIALMIATTSAIAQPVPQGPPHYTLTISAEDLAIVGRGLDELPAKFSTPVTQRLIVQITAQNEAFHKKAKEPPAPTETPAPFPQAKP